MVCKLTKDLILTIQLIRKTYNTTTTKKSFQVSNPYFRIQMEFRWFIKSNIFYCCILFISNNTGFSLFIPIYAYVTFLYQILKIVLLLLNA